MHKFVIKSSAAPIIELGPDGVYVWFKPGIQAAKTIIKSRWPVVAIDVDATGDVIGFECAPLPEEFSLQALGDRAGVHVPDKAAARAQIRPTAALQTASA